MIGRRRAGRDGDDDRAVAADEHGSGWRRTDRPGSRGLLSVAHSRTSMRRWFGTRQPAEAGELLLGAGLGEPEAAGANRAAPGVSTPVRPARNNTGGLGPRSPGAGNPPEARVSTAWLVSPDGVVVGVRLCPSAARMGHSARSSFLEAIDRHPDGVCPYAPAQGRREWRGWIFSGRRGSRWRLAQQGTPSPWC